MKPLFILVLTFLLSLTFRSVTTAGNIAMCVMLCFTALGHFKFTKGMTLMVPGFIPFKKEMVYATGVAEVLLGFGLLVPSLRLSLGLVLIALFVLMLPANIRAAVHHINYETGTTDGKGVGYLWFRVPLQAFFIVWVVYFCLMSTPTEKLAFKTAAKAHAESVLRERMAAAQQAMDMAQESANSEEKSSAGDKYETGRAMGHLQKDMHARQLAESVKELAALHAVAGTMVVTEAMAFFIGAGLGRQTLEGWEVIFLSPQAPLAQVLQGKKIGDPIVFNKITTVIRDIF
ncbi:DoxX family protein [Dinghuibacter silviterrae]|uniref:Putative membrane protein n=1 Tax=Dinghuibacter silviterrae TaxID=1539049 RepID=A0A4R8DQC4_9BACT|nr:hypothetical protein [Dinghuibacter silviterrae]TDX00334.1 putative membrane protein [Dinghuibacter silviterrae]